MASANESHTFAGEVITLSSGPAANDISALYFNHQVSMSHADIYFCLSRTPTASHSCGLSVLRVVGQWNEVRDSLPTSVSSAAGTPTSSVVDWRTLFRTVTSTTSSTPHFIPRLIALSLPSQTGYYPGIGDVIDYSALLSSTGRSSAQPSSATAEWNGRTLLRADPDDLAALQQRQRLGGRGSAAGDDSECWTDWLRVERLHDKNVFRLKPLQNEDDAFEYFTTGQETIKQQHGVSNIHYESSKGQAIDEEADRAAACYYLRLGCVAGG